MADYQVPEGTIVAFAGPEENKPDGWLVCNGDSVEVKEYPYLFEAIGHAWGNEDDYPDTFNLPDLRGLFLRGITLDSTNDPDVEGRVPIKDGGGIKNSVGSFQDSATQAPQKPFVTSNPNITSFTESAAMHPGVGGTAHGRNAADYHSIGHSLPEHTHSISRGSNNGGDAETRPKNAYVLYIIKY